jgi:hypothetical protein
MNASASPITTSSPPTTSTHQYSPMRSTSDGPDSCGCAFTGGRETGFFATGCSAAGGVASAGVSVCCADGS